jgi:hypothetical protein
VGLYLSGFAGGVVVFIDGGAGVGFFGGNARFGDTRMAWYFKYRETKK